MTSFIGESLMQFHIEGMDCASCVGKIETALARMPGVFDVRLNFATEKLELALAPDSSTQVGDIEKTIKSLGFGVSVGTSQQAASDIDTGDQAATHHRSEEHTSELQSLMRISYAVFCLTKKTTLLTNYPTTYKKA